MLTITKVLHPTDFREGTAPARRTAVALARRFGAELFFFHVLPGRQLETFVDLEPVLESDPPKRGRWGWVGDKLAALASDVDGDVSLHRSAACGLLPAPSIVDFARHIDADLIVMGASGEGREGTLGRTVGEVLHHAPCPVLTVGPTEVRSSFDVRHVLAPLDPAEMGLAELHYANELANTFAAPLSILHVLNPSTQPGVTDAVLQRWQATTRSRMQRHLDSALRRLRELGRETAPAAKVSIQVRVGLPGDEILRFVRDRAVDLIVIAVHRPYAAAGGGADLAAFVTAHAACPVLSIDDLGKCRIKRADARYAEAV